MMAILLFHTEMYYAGTDVVPYSCYVDNVLAAFFFVSGYLLYRKQPLDVHRKLAAILRHLVVPYFVFTLLFVVPKALVHDSMDHLVPMVLQIVTGQASWFVAALIVSELFFVLLIKVSEPHRLLTVAIAGMQFLIAAIVFGNTKSAHYNTLNLWHVNEAMLGCFFMAVGYVYHAHECRLKLPAWAVGALAFAMLIVSKRLLLSKGLHTVFGPIIIDSFPLFVIDNLLAISFLVSVFKAIPHVQLMSWIGRRSIVFYFICGGVPLLVGKAFCMAGFGYAGHLSVVPVYVVVLGLSALLVACIYRFYPNI